MQFRYKNVIDYYPDLLPILKHIMNKCQVIIPPKTPNNIIKSLTETKKTAVGRVYKILIKENEETKYYIGKTKRTLEKHLKEHLSSLTSDYGTTSLKCYLAKENVVSPIWTEIRIIASPLTEEQLAWREAIEIATNTNLINADSGRIIAKNWQHILTSPRSSIT